MFFKKTYDKIIKELNTKKLRLTIADEQTFKKHAAFSISSLSFALCLSLLSFIIVIITALLIFFTPIKEFVPGVSSSDLIRKSIYLANKADSLEQLLDQNTKFYKSIENVLLGKTDEVLEPKMLKTEKFQEGLNSLIAPVAEDSVLRKFVEEQDNYNLTESELDVGNKMFFSPVEGNLTAKFNFEEKHYGIDVSVPSGSPIRSVLDGRVLFSEWSFETGYVLVVMHNDNLISVYKHSKQNLKSQNDFVKAGEVIAYSGNQGQLSTGPHLHFELWQNGLPINPEPFFKFN